MDEEMHRQAKTILLEMGQFFQVQVWATLFLSGHVILWTQVNSILKSWNFYNFKNYHFENSY
jgi:hypothetical protein